MQGYARHLTQSALFIALGILIPILFHAVGMGPVFLPMFLPIVVSSFFLPVVYAGCVGIITPALSALMTGMPPPPIVYKMILELLILATLTGILYRKTRWGSFWIVFFSLLITESVALLLTAAIAPLLGLPPRLYSVLSLLRQIPGILLILFLIPLLIKNVKRIPVFSLRKEYVMEA